MMIVIDENKLSNETIMMIGKDYQMDNCNEDQIIDRFFFNVDDFKDRIMKIVKEGIKIEFKKPGV